MSLNIAKRKEKPRLTTTMSVKTLLDELNKAAPKHKAKVRNELAKRGVTVNAKTNQVTAVSETLAKRGFTVTT